MKKYFILILSIIVFIIPMNFCYAEEDTTIKEQQDEFKIQDFINKCFEEKTYV